MKIGLNATCFNDRPSGAKQRFIGIYSQLFKCLPDTEFVIYEPNDCRISSWFDGVPNVFAKCTPLPSEGRMRKLLGGWAYWPNVLNKENFDFFECFNQPVVKFPNGRTLLTIHDVRRLNTDWNGLDRMIYKAALERDLRTADHVITVSQAMKDEISGFYPDASISVIYNGLETSEFDSVTETDLKATSQKYNLTEDFVLAVGHYERRKNYLRLIDAIALLRDGGRKCNLVIIGNESGEGKAIAQRVQSANLTSQVKILSGLSDLEVRCAYKLCKLFVFPSFYEGFGIPILEAMAAGCPMALSDLPVFREITESRCVYFPYDDIEAMASAIEMVLFSSSEREAQILFGNERVKAFNFKALARQYTDLYRTILTGG